MNAEDFVRLRIERQNIMFSFVRKMNVRDKRCVFALMRTPAARDVDFVPLIGMTLGEFSMYYLLSS
jgi:hypothetical protein